MNIFRRKYLDKMSELERRLGMKLMGGIYHCDLGCFSVVDINFASRDRESKGFICVRLRAIGGKSLNHRGDSVYHNWREYSECVISLRDFLNFYKQA